MGETKEVFIILNELIGLISWQAMVEVVSSIHNANWYALIIDKATDISNKEQLCAIILWVDNDFNIFEDSIELIVIFPRQILKQLISSRIARLENSFP